MGSVLSFNGDLPLRGFDPGCRIRMIGPHRRMVLGFEPYCGIDPPHAGRWLGSDADQAAGFEPWCFYKVKGCGTAFGSLP